MSAPRRWREVGLDEVADGFEIRLDGRPLRLGDDLGLLIAKRPLAEAIRDEWQLAGQEEGSGVRPEAIELTRLAATQQHRIAPARAAMIEELLPWGRDDLLRYRDPDIAVAEEQAERWDSVLDGLARRHGLRPGIAIGLAPLVPQAGEDARWRAILSPLPDAALTALGTLVPALGSLVLALALVEDQIGPEQAVALSRLEESRQAARWGSDPVIEAKEASVLHEVRQAYRFLVLSRD